MLININFSSLNLQDHCAFIVGHTSTTGRHVSLSFDFLLSLLYLLRSINSVQFQVHNSWTAFHTYIGLCLAFISVIAEKVWYMQFTDDTFHSSLLFHTQCAWLSAFSDTADT